MSADPYVRLTVTGALRSAEVVLPTDHPLDALLPELLDLLGETGAPSRYGVFTDAGHHLAPDTPLAQLDVVDGRRVRLVSLADAPAEPVVHDLVDLLGSADVRGLWTRDNRAWVFALLGVAPVLAALWLIRDALTHPWIPVLTLFSAALGAAAARLRPSAWVLLGAAMLTGGALAGRLRAAGLATAVLVGLVALVAAAQAAGATPTVTAGILGVAALLVLGLLPRLSMAGAGLFAVDDAVAHDGRVRAERVERAVAEAHAALSATIVVTAAAMAVALAWLSGAALRGGWAAALAIVLALAFLVRSRHFPLAGHRLVIWGAVLVGMLAAVFDTAGSTGVPPAVLATACAAIGLGLLSLPAAPQATALRSAQARRIAGAVERVCVLAAIPVLVGAAGIYADLLGTFR